MSIRRIRTHLSLLAAVMLLTVLGSAPAMLAKGVLNPQVLALDDQFGRLFMTDYRNTATEYDARTGEALRSFVLSRTQLYPISAAVLPQVHHLYVGSRLGDLFGPGRLSVVDTTTGRIVRTFSIGPNPATIVLGQRTGRAYVLCSGLPNRTGGTVLLVDTQRDVLLTTVHIRDYLQAEVLDEGSGHVFISGTHGIYMLDAGSGRILHTLSMHTNAPWALAVDAQMHRVFASGGNQVRVLDSRTGIALSTRMFGHDIRVSALVVDAVTRRLLAASYNQTTMLGTLSILDATTGTLLRQVSVGHFPTAVAVLPALDRAIVINPAFTVGTTGQIVGTSEMRIIQESTGRVLVAQAASADSMVVSLRTDRAYLADTNDLLTIVDVSTGKVLF